MKMDITSVSVTKKGVVYIQAKVTCGMKKDDFKVGDSFQCQVITKEEKEKDEVKDEK